MLWWDVYFFLLLQIIDLSPSFLPFTVGSLYIFLYFTLYSLHFFLHFAIEINQFSGSILITSVLNSASDRLSISSSLSSSSGVLSVLSFGSYFSVSLLLLCCKGWSHPSLLHYGAICGGGVREGTMLLSCSTLAPLSNELSCETGIFSCLCNPHRILWLEV